MYSILNTWNTRGIRVFVFQNAAVFTWNTRIPKRPPRIPHLGSQDSTVYGIARSSPRRFYVHHLAAHASTVVFADTTTVHMCASEMMFKLSVGMVP